MKINFKQVLSLLFILGLAQATLAQLSFGVKGHISTTGAPLVENQDLFSKKLRAPFNPGFSIFLEFRLNEKMAIQPEFVFRENRSFYQLRSNVPTIHTSIINYIHFPVLFKYSQKQKWINLSFLIGPNLGYAVDMLSGETVGWFNFNKQELKSLDFEEYHISKMDIALTLGISIEKTIAQKFRTNLDLRFDFGLNDIMQDLQSTYYNRGLALEMGIMIPILLKEKE